MFFKIAAKGLRVRLGSKSPSISRLRIIEGINRSIVHVNRIIPWRQTRAIETELLPAFAHLLDHLIERLLCREQADGGPSWAGEDDVPEVLNPRFKLA